VCVSAAGSPLTCPSQDLAAAGTTTTTTPPKKDQFFEIEFE